MQIVSFADYDISHVTARLLHGDTLVYPTETCYGLGSDATNQAAVDRVFAIKQRPREKSVLIVVPDIAMAQQYVVWNTTIDQLARTYWPGPLTVVAEARPESGLAQGVVATDGTIAFRVSSYPLVVEIGSALARPLVSTSANISGEDSPYDIASIQAMFAGNAPQPDMLIDAGDLPEQSPSTIVRVHDGMIRVIRQGGIVVDI